MSWLDGEGPFYIHVVDRELRAKQLEDFYKRDANKGYVSSIVLLSGF